jgi:hypothetical protein
MHAGNIEVKIDDGTGEIEIFHKSALVFPTISPVLFYDDEWLSEKTGEIAFEKISVQSGKNYEGNANFPEYNDVAKMYLVKNGDEQFTCTLHVVVFPKLQAVYFTIEIEGNAAKSNQIGGFIDLGVPQGASRFRLFHGGEWKERIDKPSVNTSRLGQGLFSVGQHSWQNPAMAGLLPDNENLPISYLLAQMGSSVAAFVPVDRFGQMTTIRACSFLDFPNGVKFVSGNFLNAQKYDRLAGGLVAFGEDPVELSGTIYKAYMQLVNRVHALRENKAYPEPYEYIGFCTWNTFYQAVDMPGIKDLLEGNFTAKAGSDRFRYLIVDDGWQSINGMTSTSDTKTGGTNKTDRGLRRFEANSKFPNDIGEVVRLAKLKYRAKWVGVWHATMGYWNGVEPNSDLGRQYPIVHNNAHGVPDPSFFKGFEFWHDYYAHLRAQGIDLLKIDNQSCIAGDLRGLGPLGDLIDQYYDMQQGAAYSQNLAVLNCMCMPSYCFTHWKMSNVSRVSDDFGPGNLPGLKNQVKQCVFNPLFYGQFCFPDHDMVWTKPAKNACPVHPLWLVHAVSGGPIYVADEVGETDGKVIEKFSFPDGRIPRLEGVSMPTVDSVFADTDSDAPCKAWNYDDIPGWGRVFYYYMVNMVKAEKPIAASISISDMGSMAYAGNTIPAEHVVKDVESSFARTVSADNERVKTDLAPLQAKYYKISPVIRGVALLGISDVYNGTKAIERAAWENDKTLFVNLKYPGTLELYAKNPDWVTVKNMAGMSIPVQRDPLNAQLVRFHVDSACQIFLA